MGIRSRPVYYRVEVSHILRPDVKQIVANPRHFHKKNKPPGHLTSRAVCRKGPKGFYPQFGFWNGSSIAAISCVVNPEQRHI